MKLSSHLFFLSTACFLLFSACQKDEDLPEFQSTAGATSFAEVPEGLWDYFQRFEEEAAARGLNLDLNSLNISAEFMEISQDGVAGTCTYGSHQPGHVVIDETFWSRASDLFKEMIVFHELGHCVLFFDHREGVHADGTCVSIMRSGVGDCRDNYRLTTREVYLDELFGQSQ